MRLVLAALALVGFEAHAEPRCLVLKLDVSKARLSPESESSLISGVTRTVKAGAEKAGHSFLEAKQQDGSWGEAGGEGACAEPRALPPSPVEVGVSFTKKQYVAVMTVGPAAGKKAWTKVVEPASRQVAGSLEKALLVLLHAVLLVSRGGYRIPGASGGWLPESRLVRRGGERGRAVG